MPLRIFFIAVLVSGCLNPKPKPAPAPKDFTRITSDITDVLKYQQESWNKGDIDAFMTGYWNSDSLQFIGMRGIKRSYDTVTARYKKYYDTRDKMGTLTFSNLLAMPLDKDTSLVQVTGNWEVQLKDTTQRGLFSLIWKEVGQNKDWKIIIDHTW